MTDHDLFEELSDLCGGDDEEGQLALSILEEWNCLPEEQQSQPGVLFGIARSRGWLS